MNERKLPHDHGHDSAHYLDHMPTADGFAAVSDRKKDRSEAESIKAMCVGKTAMVKSVENKEKLAGEFDRLELKRCAAFVRRLNED